MTQFDTMRAIFTRTIRRRELNLPPSVSNTHRTADRQRSVIYTRRYFSSDLQAKDHRSRNQKTQAGGHPVSGTATPRYAGIPTLMRLPHVSLAELDSSPLEVKGEAGVGVFPKSPPDIGLVGIPWDGGTTNRPGARLGPRQMRDVSTMMRHVNRVTKVDPFALCRCADMGDTPVDPTDLQESLKSITAFYNSMRRHKIAPLSCGGDHLVTLPILRAIAQRNDGPLGMVQFDAHSDMWDQYFNGSKYTHGTVFRRAIEEGLLDPKRVVQIGLRGALYSDAPDSWGEQQGVTVIDMNAYHEMGHEAVLDRIHEVVGTDLPTYVSFDIDVIDPAFAPGTGTPEVGGLTTFEALRLIRGLRGLHMIGGDVVEVAPPFDPTSNTSLAACTVMYELLCILAESLNNRKRS